MRSLLTLIVLSLVLSACAPLAEPLIPTDPPTASPTLTDAPNSISQAATTIPTIAPIEVIQDPNAPTATPLFGATRTPLPDNFPTPTRPFNPNAPRIDFFTSDPLTVAPGGQVTLFWSTRNADSAVIYRLEPDGRRAQVYNVVADGNLTITTSSSERGTLRFSLSITDGGANFVEEVLVIPLECPDVWFFEPIPADCANEEALSTRIVDIQMQRGRMLYVEVTDTIYALFNDGRDDAPSWLSFDNRYDPTIHPPRDENAPPEWIQPLNELGFVWRGDEDVRSRLGLGLTDSIEFEGLIQTSGSGNNEVTYVTGSTGVVLQIEAGEAIWQIIGGPR